MLAVRQSRCAPTMAAAQRVTFTLITMPRHARLAVIIPTLNEAAQLPGLLADLQRQRGIDLEIIVADGGSRDATTAIARRAGARCVSGPPGRARQMNRGNRGAAAPWRLFLHADSRLTDQDQLATAVAWLRRHRPSETAGHWPLQFFDAPREHQRLFRFMEAKTQSGRPGTIHGDQGLLIHRSFLQKLGDFDERLPFFEDVRASERIFERGHWLLLPDQLNTSARRFEREGVRSRYALMGLMMMMNAAGDHDFLAQTPTLYRAANSAEGADPQSLWLSACRRLLRRPASWPGLAAFVWHQRWQLALLMQVLTTPSPAPQQSC